MNLIHGHVLQELSLHVSTALVFLLSLFAFLIACTATIRLALPALALTFVAYGAFAAILFSSAYAAPPIAVPVLIAGPVAFLLLGTFQYSKSREIVRRLMPRRMADALLSGEGRASQHRRMVQATIVFIDLEGSTRIGSLVPPAKFEKIMDHYYATCAREIEGRSGSIIEFKGDGVLAIFDQDAALNHARLACDAARMIVMRSEEIDVYETLTGVKSLKLRFGLHSGEVALGPIGTESRFNFNAIGDAVNTASRLEQFGKHFADAKESIVLLSGETLMSSQLSERDVVFVDTVILRGREVTTSIYKLVAC